MNQLVMRLLDSEREMPMKKVNEAKVAGLVKALLVELGEDPEREGLKKTPQRVAAEEVVPAYGTRE